MGAPAMQPENPDRLEVGLYQLLPTQWFGAPRARTGLARLARAVLLDALGDAGLLPRRGVGFRERAAARRYVGGATDGTEPLSLALVCDLLNLDRDAVVQAVRAQLGGDAETDTMRACRKKIAGSFRATLRSEAAPRGFSLASGTPNR